MGTHPEPNVLPPLKRAARKFALCLGMFLISACEKPGPVQQATAALGTGPVPRVVQCAESTDMFLDLAEKGRRGVTVLHLSSRGNLSPLSGKNISELRALVKKQRWDDIRSNANRGEQGVLGSGNYLFAAARLGLVKEIYWVLPSRLLEYSDAERRVQRLLSSDTHGFEPGKAAAMRYRNGCVSGTLSGVAAHVCGVETLPAIERPVALDIDAGFFPAYAEERNLNAMEGLKDFFEKIESRKIAVTEAYVRRTLREETLSPLHLHVAGSVAAVLERPDILRAAPPAPWSLSDAAAALLGEGDADSAAALLREGRRRYPNDAVLAMLDGIAAALRGDADRGLESLTALCARDREACYSLAYVGRKLREEGKTKAAARFLAGAVRERPDLTGAVRALAEARMEEKDYAGALALFRGLLDREDSFALRLRVGDCLLFLGRDEESREEYGKALQKADGPRGAASASAAESLKRAQALFSRAGDGKTVKKIQGILAVE